MKYCHSCQESFDVNDNLCPKCGKQLDVTIKGSNGTYNIKNPFLNLESDNNSKNQDDNSFATNKFGTFNNLNNVETSSIEYNTQPPLIKEEQSAISQNELNDGFLHFSNNNQTNNITAEEANKNLERLKKLNNPVLDFDPQKIKEQKEQKEKEIKREKKANERKEIKFISYVYIILAAVMLFMTIIPLIYDMQVEALVHHLIIIVLLVVAYKVLFVNKKLSYSIGFLSSIVMILTIIEKDYVTLILGVLLFIAEVFSLFTKNNKLKSKN